MPITPLDIHNKEFTKGFRGYDEDEVNEFLDQVIKDFEAAIREKNEWQTKAEDLEERVEHFSAIEDTLNKSIMVSQETAEEVRKSSNKESQLIIQEAEKNADRLINDALNRTKKMELEMQELKKQASVYRMRFKMLVEAQMNLLHSEEWEDIAKETPAAETDRNID